MRIVYEESKGYKEGTVDVTAFVEFPMYGHSNVIRVSYSKTFVFVENDRVKEVVNVSWGSVGEVSGVDAIIFKNAIVTAQELACLSPERFVEFCRDNCPEWQVKLDKERSEQRQKEYEERMKKREIEYEERKKKEDTKEFKQAIEEIVKTSWSYRGFDHKKGYEFTRRGGRVYKGTVEDVIKFADELKAR